MIAAALEADADYVERFTDELDEDDKRLVVRNGDLTDEVGEHDFVVGSGLDLPRTAALVEQGPS